MSGAKAAPGGGPAPIGLQAVPAEALADVRGEWAAAHRLMPGAHPFAHPDWYATWLAHFPEPGAVFLVVRREGAIIGVVPLAVEEGAASGLGNPKIQDYAGALAVPGCEREVAAAFLAWLEAEGISSCTLWGVPEGDAFAEALAVEAGGWQLAAEPEAVAPVADLGDDWEAFVASLSKHDRHELRRKLRNLQAAGDARLDVVSDPADIAHLMDSLVGMMRESHEGKARFLSPAMEAFFRAIAPAMAAAGLGRAWRLTLDGVVVAILLGFETETTWYLYNSGYDPAYTRLAVGLLSKALAMQAAIGAGKQRFDFLRGQEEYKRRLGGTDHAVRRLRLAFPAP